MSWLDLGSAALQSSASRKAARRQEEATRQANSVLQAAQNRGESLQLPYANAGRDAIDQLMGRLPELTASYDPARLMAEPGYEWGRQQGQQALEGSLAAQGLTDSGAALKRAARYGTDYATTKLNDAFNRDRASRNDVFSMLTGVGGMGQRSAESISGLGERTAQGVAGNIVGAGNAAAANDVAQGNIWGGALTQSASMFKPMGGGSKGFGSGMGSFMSGGGMGNFLAEGGRVEPVVGTRALRRAGGGGGGLSRDAVLQELDKVWAQPAQGREPGTVATLPADPTRNPRAITDDRMRKAGAYAEGGKVRRCANGGKVTRGAAEERGEPAGMRDEAGEPEHGAVRSKTPGKADKVTAHLSGGEHIIDAEVVAMLGDGNSDAGHALLEELKQRVRAFKRSAPANHTAPALQHGGR